MCSECKRRPALQQRDGSEATTLCGVCFVMPEIKALREAAFALSAKWETMQHADNAWDAGETELSAHADTWLPLSLDEWAMEISGWEEALLDR